jgi:integrative and conjugative element protein (TIGR02256 family)
MNTQDCWSANNGEYLLEITSDAWRLLEAECAEANGRETGGILIGYYSDDNSTAVITEVTLPPKDSTFGANWFVRGVIGLRTLLFRRWQNASRRTYYLGEWHYHPANHIMPSDDDIKQMKAISDRPEYQCKEPIMLIIGNKINSSKSFRVFVFPNGRAPFEYHQ